MCKGGVSRIRKLKFVWNTKERGFNPRKLMENID
jgi:hypothetical protein